jgi:hypothetical protein
MKQFVKIPGNDEPANKAIKKLQSTFEI